MAYNNTKDYEIVFIPVLDVSEKLDTEVSAKIQEEISKKLVNYADIFSIMSNLDPARDIMYYTVVIKKG